MRIARLCAIRRPVSVLWSSKWSEIEANTIVAAVLAAMRDGMTPARNGTNNRSIPGGTIPASTSTNVTTPTAPASSAKARASLRLRLETGSFCIKRRATPSRSRDTAVFGLIGGSQGNTESRNEMPDTQPAIPRPPITATTVPATRPACRSAGRRFCSGAGDGGINAECTDRGDLNDTDDFPVSGRHLSWGESSNQSRKAAKPMPVWHCFFEIENGNPFTPRSEGVSTTRPPIGGSPAGWGVLRRDSVLECGQSPAAFSWDATPRVPVPIFPLQASA